MKSWRIQAGSLLGVRIYVHAALILFVLAVIFLGQGTLIVCELIVIFLHEMGHALVAKAVRLRVEGMELSPFGGIAKIAGYMEITPVKEILVSVAGPAVNLILILLTSYAVVVIFPIIEPVEPIYNYTRLFLRANIMILCFNLLPALPMDGGRVLRALLTPVLGLARATKICAILGMATGILLIFGGFFSLYFDAFNLTLFTVGSYLFYAASKERSATPLLMLESADRKRDIVARGVIPVRHAATNSNTSIGELLSRFSPHCYHKVTVYDARMREVGEISEQELISAWLSHGPLFLVGDLLDKGR